MGQAAPLDKNLGAEVRNAAGQSLRLLNKRWIKGKLAQVNLQLAKQHSYNDV